MSKRSGLLFSIVLALFVSHVSGANFAGFNTGPFYSIVGSFISPTVPIPLRVVFDGPVPTDTFIFITSSDPMVLDVAFGGVTIRWSVERNGICQCPWSRNRETYGPI